MTASVSTKEVTYDIDFINTVLSPRGRKLFQGGGLISEGGEKRRAPLDRTLHKHVSYISDHNFDSLD